MEILEKIYQEKVSTPSDINEHLSVLKNYSEECDTIVEMGVRKMVSTWAFLMARPKKLISVDYKYPKDYGSDDLEIVKKISIDIGVDFEFILSDSRKIDLPKCDLLFIDTLHTYSQLKQELEKHSGQVNKYIIFHDTETFKYAPDTTNGIDGNDMGIWSAIEEFLDNNKSWVIHEILSNNNGLTIIKKINL